ncbi:MAG: Flp pilus assembly complex ATPase component TadA [Turicibacter sp.]|nr:Flp pilus assembly complex ATPase component TadA [Turicibacter sp.]
MSIQNLLTDLLETANDQKASDIHFMLEEGSIGVRFRVGSAMKAHASLTPTTYRQLLSYIRFHASLTLEHPLQPQSGMIKISAGENLLNARVSIIPTYRFHSLVLRIINPKGRRSLEEIPLFSQNAYTLKEMASTQAGLILISGPTGSGKTTTAYGLLQYLRDLGRTACSIEDPVEYDIDMVQLEINKATGLTYDVGIKEILRHDPDVIVIGEIRDAATAMQAIRASLTGHLVISTVHSKNVVGTIHRMLDLGVAPQELEQALVGVANQRLIKAKAGYKALFELCFGADLDEMLSSGYTEKRYRTLEEEYDLWEKTAS